MIKINVKPLSVNQAYRGRRYKTAEHAEWKDSTQSLLPPILELLPPRISLYIEYGVSSGGSDIDNLNKMTIDALQARYHFNDNRVDFLYNRKLKVKKGHEYFSFAFFDSEQNMLEYLLSKLQG